ncbi:hypothetical protein AYI69_g588 [Smittium culicis]|uniref:Uncharacterized protein n=1 Tax=Smittium culicis TaxID=133412 RepID=A0A1R1YSN0_9FUNG|nr:hypothetical protein AYI69_g588 [Smittium culicis]
MAPLHKLRSVGIGGGTPQYDQGHRTCPHMALLHKLRTVSIKGKLLNIIKGMYDAPKIAARVGNEVSNPT